MRFFEFSRCLNNDEDKNCNDKNSIKISRQSRRSISLHFLPLETFFVYVYVFLRLEIFFQEQTSFTKEKNSTGEGKNSRAQRVGAINQITEEAWRRLWIFSGSISRKKKRRYTFNQLMTFSTHPRNSNQRCCFDLRGLVLSFLPFQADPRR